MTFPGKRVWPQEDGRLKRQEINTPGAYGKPSPKMLERLPKHLRQVDSRVLFWEVTAPDGSSVILNPEIHSVTEFENGVITVYPSIVTPTWHGWLENGKWREVGETP
jgi:hypothetical protein